MNDSAPARVAHDSLLSRRMARRLALEELRAVCDPASLPFRSTAELPPLDGVIGAGVALRQTLAVTSSVNQQGEIQAVGGINEKIEGSFDVCRARGLSPEHGVVIPAANVGHLMLREDVVAAVRAGEFQVHAVGTVDEGLALLSGRDAGERGADGMFPQGSVNAMVDDSWAEKDAILTRGQPHARGARDR
jgi:hypothetical protein